MVLFRVTPGVSFHSVQEVFSDSDHRLSISGWFHSENEPEGIQNASLEQLKDIKGKDTQRDFRPLSCSESGGFPRCLLFCLMLVGYEWNMGLRWQDCYVSP